ncbi:DUF418 domain-containing protein [Stenotrophomonas sp. 24(2023)]|uniref:DUF418 domain-containing protein n=1 Tax=Stenotrophomonas sp. 24(2023) TaxID=3068324 RepID=UPI0027E18810|nr:DUF418 domain-containing protein [Stenotrophomonas sp. 24(2023)]WMJ70002.1 DUF418 domain-containing protein [Stenotrophomonas sp. 24(2023)]
MNAVAPSLQPVAAGQRITVMDSLRGFALLGILLMNMEAFAGPLDLVLTGIDVHWQGVDRWADALIYVLVQGKFFTLFSLLFGAGFAVMAQRAEAAGRAFTPFYLRRSAALLLIGLCHALLIWSGDVLVTYALASLMLLAFREAPRSWLPWLGAGSFLCGLAVMVLLGALISVMAWHAPEEGAKMIASTLKDIEQERQAYAHGSWGEATRQRVVELGRTLSALFVAGPEVLGMFLIGSWFGRSGALAEPERFQRLYARLRWIALPLGLVLAVGGTAWMPYIEPGRYDLPAVVAMAINSLSGAVLCLGYLGWFMRLRTHLAWLAPAGRMALTNYLAQSVVCTLVFYGYGAGLFEQMPRAWQVVFALGLFGTQLLASRAWLRRFRFGPMEWLWRAMTYLAWPPMRRDSLRG